MKNLTANCDNFRLRIESVRRLYGNYGDATCGIFVVPSPIDKQPLRIIAAAGEEWDHVSVSRKNRCPNWPEMAHVKDLFFFANETVMQLHVPETEHINVHPYCLHLWRPWNQEIPRPPSEFVG